MYEVQNGSNTLLVKKSKFICLIYHVTNMSDIKDILDKVNNEYKEATHICYAYKISNYVKCNDDNEPNKTAGFQILKAINLSNVTNILAIVIRYFGGIKLGTGGLSRSYFKVTKDCLDNISKTIIDNDIEIILETSLDNLKRLNNITKDLKIINKSFKEKVSYKVKINEEKLNDLKKELNNLNIKIKD